MFVHISLTSDRSPICYLVSKNIPLLIRGLLSLTPRSYGLMQSCGNMVRRAPLREYVKDALTLCRALATCWDWSVQSTYIHFLLILASLIMA